MKKIKIEKFYGAHYHAGCMMCEFTAGIGTTKTITTQDVRKAVRKHVEEAGHECWIESLTSWHYSPVPLDKSANPI